MDDVLEHDHIRSHHMLLKLYIINFSVPMIMILLWQPTFDTGPKNFLHNDEQLGDILLALGVTSFAQASLLFGAICLPKPTEKWVKFR